MACAYYIKNNGIMLCINGKENWTEGQSLNKRKVNYEIQEDLYKYVFLWWYQY